MQGRECRCTARPPSYAHDALTGAPFQRVLTRPSPNPNPRFFEFGVIFLPIRIGDLSLFFIGTRGITAHIGVMEEAAHASEAMFMEVLAPLIGGRNFSMLAIATPDKSATNHYSRLMDITDDDGELLFKTIRIALWCPDCLANSKGKDDEACPHREDLIPPWKSSERMRIIHKIMSDDQELFARENMGLLVGDQRYFISQALLKQMLAIPRVQFSDALVHYIFVGIDPSGGGSQSRFSIVSVATTNDGHAVVRALQPQKQP